MMPFWKILKVDSRNPFDNPSTALLHQLVTMFYHQMSTSQGKLLRLVIMDPRTGSSLKCCQLSKLSISAEQITASLVPSNSTCCPRVPVARTRGAA
jgi:hypothetical protein